MRIAILALQGAFAEHARMMQKIGAETFEVRQAADWEQPKDGLIIPGGESTVMLKLLHELNLFEPIKRDIEQGLPVYGTCAGLILLSKEVDNANSSYDRFATMNIHTCRNAYGRQMGSFATTAPMKRHCRTCAHDFHPRTLYRVPEREWRYWLRLTDTSLLPNRAISL